MASNSDALPLVLRREPFGGILFDPSDGTYLELDADGFDVIRRWLYEQGGVDGDDQREFLTRVQKEVTSLQRGPRPCRLIDGAVRVPAYRHATVLAAPTLVDVQLTRRCRMGCPHCYASSHPRGEHMPWELIQHVLHTIAEMGVCQLAIGGGEPLLHPRIVDTLELAHGLGIVPNLTTTGDGLTGEVLEAFSQCCGAVALSLEGVGDGFAERRRSGFQFFEESLDKLRRHDVRTVFQVTLSRENLRELGAIVDYCMQCSGLYGVIFLAYKPVGRGDGYNTALSAVPPGELYPQLREAFLRLAKHTRVGYDCCLTPGIAGIDIELGFGDQGLLEGCSAARTSVGITTGMDVVPCTFATHLPLGNLRKQSFGEIWNGEEAHRFRDRLDRLGERDDACRGCKSRASCLGGCPEWDLIRCSLGESVGR